MQAGTGKAEFYCPAMKVFKINRNLHRTDKEPMRGTFVMPDGSTRVIENIIIPPTDVHRLGIGYWQVDPCTGVNADGPDKVVINLDKEPVIFDINDMTMVAQAVPAHGTITLEDGSIGIIDVIFPDCPEDIWARPMEASEVTATGTVTFN